MSVQLLDKTRKINRLLHNNNSSKVVFNDICEVLNEILASNVLVVSKKGKVLGSGQWKDVEVIHELIDNEVGSHIDEMLNERLLSILSTKENVNLQTLGFSPEVVKGYQAIVTPIDIAGERLGTLFIYKKDELYEIDDIILSEYGTTVVDWRCCALSMKKVPKRFERNRLCSRRSVHFPFQNWKQSFIFLMNWKEQKEFLWRARSQTELGLRDLLS